MKKTSSKERIKPISGITLMALVITVIVLLILAGITVSALVGENGIINKAQEAKEATEYAQIKEEVLLAYNEVLGEHIRENLTNDEIASYLQEKLRSWDIDNEEDTVRYNSEKKRFEITYKGYLFEIDANGQVTTDRQDEKDKIEDAWSNVDSSGTGEEKADDLQEQLPDYDVTYDEEEDKIIIEGEESNWEVDPDTGEITEKVKDSTPPTISLTIIETT